jgi:putative nucleotidyltransferase with HDIG domain
VTNWILEVDRGRGIPYQGSYSSYLDIKRKRLQQEEKEESTRQRQLAEEQVLRQAERLRQTVESTVQAMGQLVEARDPYTAGHERRVAELAAAIAASLRWSDESIGELRTAALVHDIGKNAVPAEILNKPGRLSPLEFELVKGHSRSGYEILAPIDFGAPVAEVVLQHHERLDGSGYPRGLHGGEILPAARVLCIADVFEAMVTHRPYRPALPVEEATAEIRSGLGVRYDDEAGLACLRLVEDEGFAFADGG